MKILTIIVTSFFLPFYLGAQATNCLNALDDAEHFYNQDSTNYSRVINALEGCFNIENRWDKKQEDWAKFLYVNSKLFNEKRQSMSDEERLDLYRLFSSVDTSGYGPVKVSPKLTEAKTAILANLCRKKTQKTLDALISPYEDSVQSNAEELNSLVYRLRYQCFFNESDISDLGLDSLREKYDFNFPRDSIINISQDSERKKMAKVYDLGITNSLKGKNIKEARHLLRLLNNDIRNYVPQKREHDKRFIHFYNWEVNKVNLETYWRFNLSGNIGVFNSEYMPLSGLNTSINSPDLLVRNPLGDGSQAMRISLQIGSDLLRRRLNHNTGRSEMTYFETDVWVTLGPQIVLPIVSFEKTELAVNMGLNIGYMIYNRARLDEEARGPYDIVSSLRDLRPDHRQKQNSWLKLGLAYGIFDKFSIGVNLNLALENMISDEFSEGFEDSVSSFIEDELRLTLPDERLSYLDLTFTWSFKKESKPQY